MKRIPVATCLHYAKVADYQHIAKYLHCTKVADYQLISVHNAAVMHGVFLWLRGPAVAMRSWSQIHDNTLLLHQPPVCVRVCACMHAALQRAPLWPCLIHALTTILAGCCVSSMHLAGSCCHDIDNMYMTVATHVLNTRRDPHSRHPCGHDAAVSPTQTTCMCPHSLVPACGCCGAPTLWSNPLALIWTHSQPSRSSTTLPSNRDWQVCGLKSKV